MHVWITRPLEKSTALAEALQRRGLQTVVQPALNIEDYGDTRLLDRFLINPRRYFLAIFVSAEAARRFAAAAEKPIAHPPAMAIGGATGNALGKKFAKIICPQNVGDTPALLHNPMLSRPANKQIAIFGGLRGDDPDSLSPALCRALIRQGAKLTTIPLYRRVAPKADSGISLMGTSGQIGAAVAYSAETLLYMEEMTAPDNRWLKQLPLFVIHPSIMDAARMRGFGNVTVSMPAPEAMATTIAEAIMK